MNRDVFAVRRAAEQGGGTTQPNPADKLQKYFPAEALALYCALDPLTLTAFAGNGKAVAAALWASLAISVLFCALYLRRYWKVVYFSQVLISCGALVLYVSALGGPFATITGYKPVFGVIAAVIATAFLLFVKAPPEPHS